RHQRRLQSLEPAAVRIGEIGPQVMGSAGIGRHRAAAQLPQRRKIVPLRLQAALELSEEVATGESRRLFLALAEQTPGVGKVGLVAAAQRAHVPALALALLGGAGPQRLGVAELEGALDQPAPDRLRTLVGGLLLLLDCLLIVGIGAELARCRVETAG